MWKENLPNNCPPSTANEVNGDAFRILKNSTPSEDDFIPYARLYKDNPRYNNLCKSFAVSFYDSLYNATVSWKAALKRGNNIGKYIGKFHIKKADGKSEYNNKSGHISTWLYETWDISDFIPSFVKELHES